MFGLGIPELILILVLVLLVFGPRKLPELGGFLGKALRDFRDSLDRRDDGEASPPAPPTAPPRDHPTSPEADTARASADPDKQPR